MTNLINKNIDSQINSNAVDVVFSDWIKTNPSDQILREVFINMDLAMKYIHSKGYCIKSFDPKDIKILNDSLDQIKYNELLKMPNDYNDQKELIKEDIYSSAYLQIGIYTKCLNYMKPRFLSDNFDNFATFLPESDVPYYRGVVQRGASVYLSEYVVEKKRRDLQSLEQGVNSSGNTNEKGKSLVKTNGYNFSNDELLNQNTNINSSIYGSLDNRKEAAFVSFVACLSIFFLVGFIVLFVIYLINTF